MAKGKNRIRNKLVDLNNHLFEQLERLNDEDLTSEELENEVKRGRAMSEISRHIISNASLSLQAAKYFNSDGAFDERVPEMLTTGEGYEDE